MSKMPFAVACAMYKARFTAEHVPAWARKPAGNGRHYAPQYKSDREWYDNTAFPPDNPLGPRVKDCYSATPTWPFGEWLSEPFAEGVQPKPAEVRDSSGPALP